jgi:flagellar export protein FliJ
MSKFRFRAQAALDLRRKELEAAQQDLARAERDRDAARQRVEEADARVQGARQSATEAGRGSGSASELEWYRFWILRLDHERHAAATALAAREAEVIRAAAACIHAKQRCESLEKMRENAERGHRAAERDAERKVIDELATRRFKRSA